jgi:hypothetical protein
MDFDLSDAQKDNLLDYLGMVQTAEDLERTIRLLSSQSLKEGAASRLLARRDEIGGFTDIQQVYEAVGEDAQQFGILVEALKNRSLDDLLGLIDYAVLDASRSGKRVATGIPTPGLGAIAALRVEDFHFPEIDPPDPTEPTTFPYRISRAQPARRYETRRGDCVERQTVQFLTVRGPIQSRREHVLDIVIVEPTGSSGGTSMGATIGGVDAIFSTYNVVLLEICVEFRWQLAAIIKRVETVLRCPPPRRSSTNVVEEVQSAYWDQIEEIFPLPCRRTVLYTTGASAQSYEEAIRWANDYANQSGLERGIGSLADHR